MENLFNIVKLDEQKSFDGKPFPLTVSPKQSELKLEELLDLIKDSRDLIKDEAMKYGAILFRDFPIRTAEEFNQFIMQFGWKDMPYTGGVAFRTNIVGAVHTA